MKDIFINFGGEFQPIDLHLPLSLGGSHTQVEEHIDMTP